MAKTFVIKQPDGDKVPFLRGILVRSLANAGLSFKEAYGLAQRVKTELRDVPEITSRELKQRVAALLAKQYGDDQRLAYEARPRIKSEILVHTPTRSAPFSVGILMRSLEACSIPSKAALRGARKVYASLLRAGHTEIDHKSLRQVIYRCLNDHCSAEYADRYLSWRQFENSGEPLIVLIGGATGAGKSTIASEVAYRLSIGRVQSTDMMREIIRAYQPADAASSLDHSSFEAWRGLDPDRYKQTKKHRKKVIEGFLAQFGIMQPALNAAIARAVREGHDLIIEGVHALPTQLDLGEANKRAIVVPLMIATLERATLRKRLKRRGHEAARRKADRYLDHLDDIWELQSYLLDEADRAGLPIIENWNIEDAVREVLDAISNQIVARYPPRPDRISESR